MYLILILFLLCLRYLTLPLSDYPDIQFVQDQTWIHLLFNSESLVDYLGNSAVHKLDKSDLISQIFLGRGYSSFSLPSYFIDYVILSFPYFLFCFFLLSFTSHIRSILANYVELDVNNVLKARLIINSFALGMIINPFVVYTLTSGHKELPYTLVMLLEGCFIALYAFLLDSLTDFIGIHPNQITQLRIKINQISLASIAIGLFIYIFIVRDNSLALLFLFSATFLIANYNREKITLPVISRILTFKLSSLTRLVNGVLKFNLAYIITTFIIILIVFNFNRFFLVQITSLEIPLLSHIAHSYSSEDVYGTLLQKYPLLVRLFSLSYAFNLVTPSGVSPSYVTIFMSCLVSVYGNIKYLIFNPNGKNLRCLFLGILLIVSSFIALLPGYTNPKYWVILLPFSFLAINPKLRKYITVIFIVNWFCFLVKVII